MRVLLADDHSLFRDGIASLLEAWGHDVVGLASNGAQAVEMAKSLAPDLVLMDVRMPGMSGLVATGLIHEARPEVSIVMLTVSEDEDDLFAAVKAGAQGYLLKNLEAAEFRSLLEAVSRGEPALSPATASRIIDELRHPSEAGDAGPDQLTGSSRCSASSRLDSATRRSRPHWGSPRTPRSSISGTSSASSMPKAAQSWRRARSGKG
jgi:DNA-binding NarL/FixJ family response regulator